MKYDNFFSDSVNTTYYVSSYFYRVEFQQRGAPHVHSLLWLKDKDGKDAPTFWSEQTEDSSNKVDREDNLEKRKKDIETFVDLMMSTSPTDIKCGTHVNCDEKMDDCPDCQLLVDKVSKYQKHNHTFTCKKKGKTINIKSNEGHGIDDGIKNVISPFQFGSCILAFDSSV